MDLSIHPFSELNLDDSFFDSLKSSYPEFTDWFNRKAAANEPAYVFFDEEGHIMDFLYLKVENEAMPDMIPAMPAKKRLKVGTFKIMPRHSRRGERFMKKIMDRAIAEDVDEILGKGYKSYELNP